MREEVVRFANRYGLNLVGTLLLPDAAAPRPAVLFIMVWAATARSVT